MNVIRNNNGFSLIELIVVVMIMTILAGIAIVSYIGVRERARVAMITRTASSSSAELLLWLQASFSSQSLREIDTNFDGAINKDDMTNIELFKAGVANTYTNGRNIILKETSPWLERPLWSLEDPPPNGTINVTQPLSDQIKIVAREKNGSIVYEQIIFSN
jgi:prepilin-type N-terminal cleavage/methylation domain-containing protein